MLHSFPVRSALATAAGLLLLSIAYGNPVPADVAFKISGSGAGDAGLPLPGQAPRDHWSVGHASHLGRYTGLGAVQTDSAVIDPTIGPAAGFTGEFGSGTAYTFTAADGSQLVTWYGRTDHGATTPGTFTLTILGPGDGGLGLTVQAEWIAEFVIDSDVSTGRFAGASGSWIMFAHSQPFVLGSEDPVFYSWEGEGRIRLK